MHIVWSILDLTFDLDARRWNAAQNAGALGAAARQRLQRPVQCSKSHAAQSVQYLVLPQCSRLVIKLYTHAITNTRGFSILIWQGHKGYPLLSCTPVISWSWTNCTVTSQVLASITSYCCSTGASLQLTGSEHTSISVSGMTSAD